MRDMDKNNLYKIDKNAEFLLLQSGILFGSIILVLMANEQRDIVLRNLSGK